MTDSINRIQLLRDTVYNLESQKNFPFSAERRQEWEIAINEARQLLQIELKRRHK